MGVVILAGLIAAGTFLAFVGLPFADYESPSL
jgi:hypothetical protein